MRAGRTACPRPRPPQGGGAGFSGGPGAPVESARWIRAARRLYRRIERGRVMGPVLQFLLVQSAPLSPLACHIPSLPFVITVTKESACDGWNTLASRRVLPEGGVRARRLSPQLQRPAGGDGMSAATAR